MIASLMALSMTAAADCRHIGSHAGIRFVPAVARPGDRLSREYWYRDGPDGEKPVPRQCVEKMRVKGDAAVISKGGIRITGDAKAGSVVTAVALIGGREVSANLTVVGRGQPVLTGKWRQISAEHCHGRRLAELIFTTEGTYSFTFPDRMIETMTSGGGSYRWDPASGRIDLGHGWVGLARRSGSALTIDGVDFDPRALPPPLPPGTASPPRAVCRIVLTGG